MSIYETNDVGPTFINVCFPRLTQHSLAKANVHLPSETDHFEGL